MRIETTRAANWPAAVGFAGTLILAGVVFYFWFFFHDTPSGNGDETPIVLLLLWLVVLVLESTCVLTYIYLVRKGHKLTGIQVVATGLALLILFAFTSIALLSLIRF